MTSRFCQTEDGRQFRWPAKKRGARRTCRVAESRESTPAALLPAPRRRVAMLAPSIAPRAGVTCTASARGSRERHSAWRRSGGSDRRARGKQRRDEKAHAGRSRRASSSAEAPDNEWGANHEEWRVYVRSLTGLTRRAALMATVGGLSLGPARADEAESSSVVDASSTSDDDAASFGGGSPSVGATSADAPPTAAPADDPWEGSYVKPAMTVPQYMEEVRGYPFAGRRAFVVPFADADAADGFRYPTPRDIFSRLYVLWRLEGLSSHDRARSEQANIETPPRAVRSRRTAPRRSRRSRLWRSP